MHITLTTLRTPAGIELRAAHNDTPQGMIYVHTTSTPTTYQFVSYLGTEGPVRNNLHSAEYDALAHVNQHQGEPA
jgi:hypothetical protein